jgi:hypothetical protein
VAHVDAPDAGDNTALEGLIGEGEEVFELGAMVSAIAMIGPSVVVGVIKDVEEELFIGLGLAVARLLAAVQVRDHVTGLDIEHGLLVFFVVIERKVGDIGLITAVGVVAGFAGGREGGGGLGLGAGALADVGRLVKRRGPTALRAGATGRRHVVLVHRVLLFVVIALARLTIRGGRTSFYNGRRNLRGRV